MKRLAAMSACVVAGLASGGSLAAEPGALRLAQITLDFGVSEPTVRRALRRDGYRDIDIYYRGMTKARARACKRGVRYQLEIAPSGRVKAAAKIGVCRARIDVRRAHDILRGRGYGNILLEEMPDGAFRGAACLGPGRLEMEVNPFGEVRELRRLGRCRHLLSRPEVAARLRSRGYDRVSFEDTPPPPFIVTACRDLDRVRLVVVGSGRIQRERRIGRCEPAIDPRRIAEVLERRGYSRVRVTDDVLPRYAAVACRDGRRLEIVLNRFGEIRDRREIGRCASPLTRAQLADKLRAEGFRGIRFIEGTSDGFLVEACQGDKRLRISFSRYGETDFERPLGPCRSPRIGKLIDDFERRGLTGVTLFMEGCRDGRRMRVELDRFGSPVDARRVGRCR